MLGAKRQGQNENKNLEKKCMPKFGPKYEQKRPFFAIFRYRRIGRNGRIFGTEYSAGFGRIFGRIFGIRSYTTFCAGFHCAECKNIIYYTYIRRR